MAALGVSDPEPASPPRSKRLLRWSGILAFLGLLAYALMFAGFAYEDRNLLEGLGAAGMALSAVAVLLATIAVTGSRRGTR